MKRKLVIFGNSLMSEVAYYYFNNFTDYSNREIIFASDKKFIKSKKKFNCDVITSEKLLKIKKNEIDLFIAIGYSKLNTIRQHFYHFFKKRDFNFTNFIHPSSKIYSKKIGRNNFIMENVSINPFTQVNDNNIIWSSTVIGHHNYIGSNNFFSGNTTISGNSKINDNIFFGVNSCTKDKIKIGSYSFIDAGEYVSKSLKNYSFINKSYNPQNKIKTKDSLLG